MPPKRNAKRPAQGASADAASGERLNKVLAGAGHGSRRACEELILAGRVEVDGQVVRALATRVDPSSQEVRVDGTPLARKRHVYFAVNKPAGVLTTSADPAGRMRVLDLVPSEQRLFAVGRLDKSSEGLILVTNDGDLANHLAHPRYGVEKIYQVEVAGKLEPEHLRALRDGIRLAEAVAHAEKVVIKRQRPHSTVLEITLREGRNREIRRMLAGVGHKVVRLRRIALGPLRLGEMPTGAYRELTPFEVQALRASAGPAAASAKGARPGKSTRSKSPAGDTNRPAKKSSRGTVIGGGPAGQRNAPGGKRPPGKTARGKSPISKRPPGKRKGKR